MRCPKKENGVCDELRRGLPVSVDMQVKNRN